MFRLIALCLALFSAAAFGASGPYIPKLVLDDVSAASNQTSSGVDMGDDTKNSSFQANWSSLTGTIDGTIKVQCSNDGSNWTDKTGATMTLSGDSGSNIISLNGVVTELKCRAVYTKNNITGGSITVIAHAKRT